MRKRSLRIGVSALFNPDDTPHARTFLRALAQARNTLPALARMRLSFADDGADPTAAHRAAQDFLEAGVDLVIGHFSSDAALRVADLYARHSIPLLTPAATTDALTDKRWNVFRLCPPDRELARCLVWFAGENGWQSLYVESDDSAHGHALAHAIRETCERAGLALRGQPQDAHATVFAGRLAASRHYWRTRRAKGDAGPIVLTDDAVSPHMGAARAGDLHTFAIGFPPADAQPFGAQAARQHLAIHGTAPETYFLESLTAFHVAAALSTPGTHDALIDRLTHDIFQTPLGPLHFEYGERVPAHHAIWQVTPRGLQPMALYPC